MIFQCLNQTSILFLTRGFRAHQTLQQTVCCWPTTTKQKYFPLSNICDHTTPPMFETGSQMAPPSQMAMLFFISSWFILIASEKSWEEHQPFHLKMVDFRGRVQTQSRQYRERVLKEIAAPCGQVRTLQALNIKSSISTNSWFSFSFLQPIEAPLAGQSKEFINQSLRPYSFFLTTAKFFSSS